jgi:2-haloacid dehalogenase
VISEVKAKAGAIRACVFDAYGTLFDLASVTARCEDELGDKVKPLAALWRDKQLQYTWLRGLQDRHADFWKVTGDSLDYAMDELAIASPSLRSRLMDMYLSVDVFPEVPGVLRRLKARGLVTAILSNGTPTMLSAALHGAGLADLIDKVFSVEAVGVYKPHPRVYQHAVDQLGVPAQSISFQSSNGWDAYAASAFGMQAVWCNRDRQRDERLPGKPAAVIRSMDELPSLLGLS